MSRCFKAFYISVLGLALGACATFPRIQEKVLQNDVLIPLPIRLIQGFLLNTYGSSWEFDSYNVDIKQTSFESFYYQVWAYRPYIAYSGDRFYKRETMRLRKTLKEAADRFYGDLNRQSSKNYDVYNNEYLWRGKRTEIQKKWGPIWKDYTPGQNEGHQFSQVSEKILKGDYIDSLLVWKQSHPEPQSRIVQTKWESTRHFSHRVQALKNEIDAYRTAFVGEEKRAFGTLKKIKNLVLYRTFSLYFGKPVITNIEYNPDSRLFGIDIKGENEGRAGNKFHFLLADRVMNDVAPAYDRRIRKAFPSILLRIKGNSVIIDGGYLVFPDGTEERLLPYHEKEFLTKTVQFDNIPDIREFRIPVPKVITSNPRMKSEGEEIDNNTPYFQGIK